MDQMMTHNRFYHVSRNAFPKLVNNLAWRHHLTPCNCLSNFSVLSSKCAAVLKVVMEWEHKMRGPIMTIMFNYVLFCISADGLTFILLLLSKVHTEHKMWLSEDVHYAFWHLPKLKREKYKRREFVFVHKAQIFHYISERT